VESGTSRHMTASQESLTSLSKEDSGQSAWNGILRWIGSCMAERIEH
jgi:hypothetical protein